MGDDPWLEGVEAENGGAWPYGKHCMSKSDGTALD